MNQFGSILRLRRSLAKNRLTDLSPRRRVTMLALLVTGALALIASGHLAAPSLMEPPIDLATPRGLGPDALPAGAAALEAAFWLTALLASILNFRVLELLFRRPDIVAMQSLPIEPSALFLDRFFASCTEAVVASAAASLFFVPLLWHGGTAAFVASVIMVTGGLLFGVALSLMVMLTATRQLIPDSDAGGSRRPSITDAYGGQGQLLLYAPAVSLGGIVMLALFWKLLLGEPLRHGAMTEPFWLGCAVIAAIAGGCLLIAYRAFVDDYYAMAPRFHEADSADFSAVADYQTSSYDETKSLWELGLPPRTAGTYRALVLDDDRRIAGGRVGYAVVLILAIMALAIIELPALPLWAAAMIPATLSAAIVNPWHRLTTRVRLLDDPLGLPVATVDRRIAASRAALREFLLIGVPYSIAAVLILGHFRGLGVEGGLVALCALSSGFGIAGGVSIGVSLGSSDSATRWLPAALLAGLTACAIVSLSAAIAVSVAVMSAALIVRSLTIGTARRAAIEPASTSAKDS